MSALKAAVEDEYRRSDFEGLQVLSHSAPEVYEHSQNTHKEVYQQQHNAYPSPRGYPLGDYSGNYKKSASAASPASPLLCGIRRRVFLVIVAIVLVIASAIAGGVAGALTKKSYHTKSATATQGSSPSPTAFLPTTSSTLAASSTSYPMLAKSQLASIAWNDTKGITFQRLYYQDSNNAIRESAWNSTGQAWYTNGEVIANAKKGTAIAATVTGPPDWPFQISVYAVAAVGTIAERNFNSDNAWSDGPLTSGNVRAAKNSSLTAIYHRHANCPLCPNTQLLIYQNETGKWNLGNATASGWVWSNLPANPIAGSPSALSIYSQPANFTAQLRFWYLFPSSRGNENVICGLDWTIPPEDEFAAANNNWANRESNCLAGATIPSAYIASFTYGTAKNDLNLFMGILNSDSNKGITNQLWLGADGGFWADPQKPFVMSSIDADSAVAANAQAHVFGVVGGRVNEFVLGMDGVTWNLVGGVVT